VFLDANVDANGGSPSPASMRVWEAGESLAYVITNYNQERTRIQVCGQGCQGASPGSHVDADGDFRLKDVTVKGRDAHGLHALSTFWGVNRGTNTYCPPRDFYGRSRSDGSCDIGRDRDRLRPPGYHPPGRRDELPRRPPGTGRSCCLEPLGEFRQQGEP